MSNAIKTSNGTGYKIPEITRFSGADPKEGEGECFLCGRGVKMHKRTAWVELFEGGSLLADQSVKDANQSDSGYMGCYPIGPNCKRKLPPSVPFTMPPGEG